MCYFNSMFMKLWALWRIIWKKINNFGDLIFFFNIFLSLNFLQCFYIIFIIIVKMDDSIILRDIWK